MSDKKVQFKLPERVNKTNMLCLDNPPYSQFSSPSSSHYPPASPRNASSRHFRGRTAAPATRITSPQHARSKSATVGTRSVRSLTSRLSLVDIYNSLDGQRSKASRAERFRAIEQAQRYVTSRSASPLEFTSFLNQSRPQSSASSLTTSPGTNRSRSEITESRHSGNEPMLGDADNRESTQSMILESDDQMPRCLTSFSAPPFPHRITTSKTCIRSQSAMEREMESVVNSLSRQCCDVLGPGTCHQCALIQRRDRDHRKSQEGIAYPNLHPSEENFSTAVLVSKACPHLNAYQVQAKLVCGEISNPGIRHVLERRQDEAIRTKRRNQDDEFSPRSLPCQQTKRVSVCQESCTAPYFSNIRKLNLKLIAGEDHKVENVKQISVTHKPVRHVSFSETINPVFVSSKNVTEEPKASYTAFYDPPLLPKVCQNATPSFYAGSDTGYQLPDRLPAPSVHTEEVDNCDNTLRSTVVS